MNYTARTYGLSLSRMADWAQLSAKVKNHITIKDVVKFFVQYMKNDQLGMIANAHLGILYLH